MTRRFPPDVSTRDDKLFGFGALAVLGIIGGAAIGIGAAVCWAIMRVVGGAE